MMESKIISDYITMNNGIVSVSQMKDIGISKHDFYQYVKKANLRQISHGVYASENAWEDEMYLIHLRSKQAVFSHETALFFHNLSDREPLPYSITVKTNYNPSKLKASGIQVYTIKKELHHIGLIYLKTTFGNYVPVYDMERTLCDIIRNRTNTENKTLQDALKFYLKRKDRDIGKLLQYASAFHVEKILRQYLEILL